MDSNLELLIVRHLCGDLNDNEEADFQQKLASDDAFRMQFTQLSALWNMGENLNPAMRLEQTCSVRWAQFRNQCFSKSSGSFAMKRMVRWAAVWVAFVGVGTALYLSATVNPSRGWTSFYSENKVDSVVLGDYTKVIAAAQSRVTYKLEEHKRQARVDGIAYFEVAPDQTRPFFVQFPDAELKVVGTSFWVEHIEGRNQIAIEVTEGKVQLTHLSETVVLVAGERGVIAQGRIRKIDPSVSSVQDWKQRNLILNQAPIEEVVTLLLPFYPELIAIRDLSTRDTTKVSTHFQNQPLGEVLDELAMHFHKKFVFKDGVLQITD